MGDNTHYSQETDFHTPGRIRTRNPSKRAIADINRRVRGHWGRHKSLQVKLIVLHSVCCTSCRTHEYQFLPHFSAPHKRLSWLGVKQAVLERDKHTKANASSNNSNHFSTKDIYLVYYPDQQMQNIHILSIFYIPYLYIYNIYIYLRYIKHCLYIYIYLFTYLFSRLYNVSTFSCAHLTII